MNNAAFRSGERIALIDSLRGFALMGLFLVHMVEYFDLYWYRPEKSVFNDFAFLLFGGKAYVIFALLFGVSFFIIMDNQRRKGIDFRAGFAWRLFILLVIGFLHSLVYGGDILVVLAITGFILIPLFNFRDGVILFISLFFLLQIPAIIYFVIQVNSGISAVPSHWALFGKIFGPYANGTFMELIHTTLWDAQAAKWVFMVESGRLSTIIGASILGFLLGRIDFFRKVEEKSLKVLRGFLFFTLLTMILFTLADKLPMYSNWLAAAIMDSYKNLSFTFAGILFFIYIFNSGGVKNILLLLSPAGKMSLTVYIFQSLVFVPFYYGFGLAAYSYIGQAGAFFLGIFFWVIQLIIADYWNKHYYYGPLEWSWRAATYRSINIPFKKAEP